MSDDGLIDGRTCDAFVATDWDADPSDMAKRAARVRAGSDRTTEEDA